MRRQRIERNWTQAELASRTRGAINTSTLAGYESGHRKMRLASAVIIAAALGMRFSVLAEIVEQSVVDGTNVLLDARRITATTDPHLEPVRRWLRTTHPEPVGTPEFVSLSTPALHALFEVIGIGAVQGRLLLAPFLDIASTAGIDTTRSRNADTASKLTRPARPR